MICNHCHYEVKENHTFCPQCGTKITPNEKEEIRMKIEEEPLIVEPMLNNDDQPSIVQNEEEIIPEAIDYITNIKKQVETFIQYIKSGLKQPFASVTTLTEKEFPFSLALFLIVSLLVPFTLYLFMNQALNRTISFSFGTYNVFLPFWSTIFSFILSVILIQAVYILLFILIVKLQRSMTSFKLLFTRYMHINILSVIGVILAFFIAIINATLGLWLTMGAYFFQFALVGLLFFIERRENKTLLDPVYNILLFGLGSVGITTFYMVNVFFNYI